MSVGVPSQPDLEAASLSGPARTGESGGTYLFVLPWRLHHPGGVNQAVINLYRECKRRGIYRPLILTAAWDFVSPTENVQEGCDCLFMKIRPVWGKPVDILGYLLGGLSMLLRLRRMLRAYDVRVVNVHYPTPAALNFTLLKALGWFRGRLVMSVHGLDIRSASASAQPQRGLWRWMLRSADAVVCVSQAMGADVEKLDKGKSIPYAVIRNGVDEDAIRAEGSEAANVAKTVVSGARPFLLNVGTFEHKKGQDVLVDAFAAIAGDFPALDLLMVGRDSDRLPALKEQIQSKGLDHRVRCVIDRPHAEVVAIMQGAAAFVLPSRAEGLPLVLLEAGALGLPVVATNVGGNPELIQDEESGLLVPSDDARALERALRRVLGDAGLGKRLAGALQRRVREQFTWRRAWQAYQALVAPAQDPRRDLPSG